jgi:hypothetical protein
MVQPPVCLSQEPPDLGGLEPDCPPWLSLVFECFRPPLMRFSLPAWLSREPCDLSGLGLDSPPGPSCSLPLELLFRMVYAYCILCTHCILFKYYVTFCFSMIHFTVDRIFLFNCFKNPIIAVYHQYILLLFDYCLLFWSWKCIQGISILLTSIIYKSINIIHHKTCLLSS